MPRSKLRALIAHLLLLGVTFLDVRSAKKVYPPKVSKLAIGYSGHDGTSPSGRSYLIPPCRRRCGFAVPQSPGTANKENILSELRVLSAVPGSGTSGR
jgi:hypothetical protein